MVSPEPGIPGRSNKSQERILLHPRDVEAVELMAPPVGEPDEGRVGDPADEPGVRNGGKPSSTGHDRTPTPAGM
jgi:hypothetical protein